MTLKEVSNQLYSLAVAGYFNGEKFTRDELYDVLWCWMRTGNRVIMEIALPDGRWPVTITRYADRRDGYDYYIPDDKDGAERVWNLLREN